MELRDKNGLTEQEFLNQYHQKDYPRPSLTADIAVFTVGERKNSYACRLPQLELKLLLVKRGGHPFLGCWALPGGFAEPGEDLEQTASRELEEETGVKNIPLTQMRLFSAPKRDPRSWVVSCAYLALVRQDSIQVKAGDDAQQAGWFSVSYRLVKERRLPSRESLRRERWFELALKHNQTKLNASVLEWTETGENGIKTGLTVQKQEGFAFDHAEIAARAVRELRQQTRYGFGAVQLMPKYFTLDQLQQYYEVILGRQLSKQTFRQAVAPAVEATSRFDRLPGQRTRRLYRRALDGLAVGYGDFED